MNSRQNPILNKAYLKGSSDQIRFSRKRYGWLSIGWGHASVDCQKFSKLSSSFTGTLGEVLEQSPLNTFSHLYWMAANVDTSLFPISTYRFPTLHLSLYDQPELVLTYTHSYSMFPFGWQSCSFRFPIAAGVFLCFIIWQLVLHFPHDTNPPVFSW